MKRYPHYWWSAKGARYPSRIVVIDADSEEQISPDGTGEVIDTMAMWSVSGYDLRMGVPQRGVEGHGDGINAAWDAIASLLSSRDQTWCFMSPSGRLLKLLQFWEKLELRTIQLAGKDWIHPRDRPGSGEDKGDGICIIEDPPTVISMQLPDRPGKLLILDIRNWGIELLPVELSGHERCTRYCEGIRHCLSTLRDGGQGTLRCTAASQAVSSLRTAHPVVRLHCHVNHEATLIERAAYYGGRCECYRIGDLPGPIYHLDVRSMYPSLCLNLPIPVSLRRVYESEQECAANGSARPENCCAHVRVKHAVPTCPLRTRGYTVYGVGEYNTYLCGAELRAAVVAGHVTRWYSAAEYTTAPYLAGYYEWWLERLAIARREGRAMEVMWIKRVMNALVGKFGEPGKRWVPCSPMLEHGPYAAWSGQDRDGNESRYRNVANHTMREEIHGESYWSIPAIAAWITAAGRCRLWSYVESAGRYNVWYVDTDSIICNRDGFEALLLAGYVREGETGHLRLVGSHSRGSIYGIRHYSLDNVVVCAGVPRGEIAVGETRPEYWERIRIRDEVNMGSRPGTRGEWRPVASAEPYHHGTVLPDGRVIPLEVYDDV